MFALKRGSGKGGDPVVKSALLSFIECQDQFGQTECTRGLGRFCRSTHSMSTQCTSLTYTHPVADYLVFHSLLQ